MNDTTSCMTTVKTIETVAQHGYLRIAELLDQNRIHEAREIALVLKELGIV